MRYCPCCILILRYFLYYFVVKNITYLLNISNLELIRYLSVFLGILSPFFYFDMKQVKHDTLFRWLMKSSGNRIKIWQLLELRKLKQFLQILQRFVTEEYEKSIKYTSSDFQFISALHYFLKNWQLFFKFFSSRTFNI